MHMLHQQKWGADPESSRAAGSSPHHVTLALEQKCLCLHNAVLSLFPIFSPAEFNVSTCAMAPSLTCKISCARAAEFVPWFCFLCAFLIFFLFSSPPFAILLCVAAFFATTTFLIKISCAGAWVGVQADGQGRMQGCWEQPLSASPLNRGYWCSEL